VFLGDQRGRSLFDCPGRDRAGRPFAPHHFYSKHPTHSSSAPARGLSRDPLVFESDLYSLAAAEEFLQ
jgi:hypothetical protein